MPVSLNEFLYYASETIFRRKLLISHSLTRLTSDNLGRVSETTNYQSAKVIVFLIKWAYDSVIGALPKDKLIRRGSFRALPGIAICIFTVSAAVAQGTSSRSPVADKYLISAKAGGVNYTEGEVTVIRAGGTSGVLVKGDQLEIRDSVTAGEDGRAEILLNPGSYLRIGANSSFEFKTTSLDDLQIKLNSGSAMFEVFATDKFRVGVVTPKEKLWMFESGVYRIDLQPDGSGTIFVTEGKAAIGKIGSLKLVTGGNMATFGNGSVTIAKFKTGKRDDLAEWSKNRSKALAKLTASLQNDNARNSLLSSFNGGRWSLYDSFGLWVRVPLNGFSCFLPFGRGWHSPSGSCHRTR